MSKPKALGFGFIPEQNEHHFVVTLSNSLTAEAPVTITECFELCDEDTARQMEDDGIHSQLKVELKRYQWDAIEDEIKAEFNRRLRASGVKSGKWKKRGTIPVDRTLGKELVVLAWAIEDAETTLAYTAVRNWLGLAPEERWWLYTMTNAATGHAKKGRGVGWRKAIRFALTENPVSGAYMPKVSNKLKMTTKKTTTKKTEQTLFED